jgi:putative inorganic carbon (HCO3(-)) transporter
MGNTGGSAEFERGERDAAMALQPPPGRLGVSVPQAVAFVLAVALSVRVGVGLIDGSSRRSLLLQVGAVCALGMVLLALNSFRYFAYAFILVRPSLDWPKSVGLDAAGLLAVGSAGLLVAASCLWLVVNSGRATWRPSAIARSALILLATLVLASATSLDRGVSAASLARTTASVVLLVVLERMLVRRADAITLLRLAFASAVVPLLVGAAQIVTGNYVIVSEGVNRATGTFVHPNTFGFYLVMIIVMGVPIYRYLHGTDKRLMTILLLAASVELIFTYSRGGWLTLIIGLTVVGMLQIRWLLAALPLAAGAALLLVPGVSDRLSDLEETESATGTAGNSLFWRFDHWRATLDVVDDRYMTGVGPGVSDLLLRLPPHNDAVRLYVEAGAFGLVAYLGLLGSLLYVARRCLLHAPGGFSRGVTVGFAALAVAFVVDSAGANLISQIVILTYLFVFAAAAQVAVRTPDTQGAQEILRPPDVNASSERQARSEGAPPQASGRS